jgi:hypothetical protein
MPAADIHSYRHWVLFALWGHRLGKGPTGVSHSEWVRQLAELALYFLLWTEAANARHTPELLWLLHHMMLSSRNFAAVGAVRLPVAWCRTHSSCSTRCLRSLVGYNSLLHIHGNCRVRGLIVYCHHTGLHQHG